MTPDFVDAAVVVPGLLVDIRYAGSRNFIGRPVDGYHAPRCLLTRAAAAGLAAVQADLSRDGLCLKVFDGYRPARAVAHFARWAEDPDDIAMKADYYPDIDKADLFSLGYLSLTSSHSRGSAVDLTLAAPDSGVELPMGGAFDFFGARSHGDYPHLAGNERANRDRLAHAMRARGFVGYIREWWHFRLADEPYPDASFDVPINP